MENRNILMVIISISALFVIVFGIALMITWPKSTADKGESLSSAGNIISNGAILKPTATPPGMQKTDEPVTTGSTLEKEQIIGAVDEEKISQPDIEVKVTEADKTSPLVTDNSGKVPYSVIDRNSSIKPAVVERSTPAKVIEPKPVTIPQNYPKRVTEYWIQAGSFKNRVSAENQNNKLAEKGFPGQVKTRVIADTTYYRVRIGPYSNKMEAGKFLAWIKEIPDLAESYISEAYVIR